MNPSVKSEANLFIAPKSGNNKEVIINSNVYILRKDIIKLKRNALNELMNDFPCTHRSLGGRTALETKNPGSFTL